MASFELYRREVSGDVVATLGVVEHLYVVEDVGPGLDTRRVDLATDPLTFEQLEEALGHGVVMAVAAPAHAGGQVVIAQEVLPVVASELTALVRVNGDRLLGLPAP